MSTSKKLSAEQQNKLLSILEKRFEKNTQRHKGMEWSDGREKLIASPEKLWSLNEMEKTEGNLML